MDIDVTLLFQLTLFLFLLVFLTGVLFKPFMRVLEARYQKIEGARSEVDRLSRLAQENQVAWESRIRDARNVARREREALRAAGADERRRMLGEVRNEIAQALNRTREQVAASESEARVQLSTETEQLARRLVSKVIGREVTT